MQEPNPSQGAKAAYQISHHPQASSGRGAAGPTPACNCLWKTRGSSQQQHPSCAGSGDDVAAESGFMVPGMPAVLQQEVAVLPKVWFGAACERSGTILFWLRRRLGWRATSALLTRMGTAAPFGARRVESQDAFSEEKVQAEKARSQGRPYGWEPWIQRPVQRRGLAGRQLAAAIAAVAAGCGSVSDVAAAAPGRWQVGDLGGFESCLHSVRPGATGYSDGAHGQDGGCRREGSDEAVAYYCQAAWGCKASALQNQTSEAGASDLMAAVRSEDSRSHRGRSGAVRPSHPGVRSTRRRGQRESRYSQKGSQGDQFKGQGGRYGAGRLRRVRRGAGTGRGGHRLRRQLPASDQAAANGTSVHLPKAAGTGRDDAQKEGQSGAPSVSRSCIVYAHEAQPLGAFSGNARPHRKPKRVHTHAADFYRTDLHSVRAEDDYKSPYIALLLGSLASAVLTLDSTVTLAVASAIGDTALHFQHNGRDEAKSAGQRQSHRLQDFPAFCYGTGAFWHMDSWPDVEPSLQQHAGVHPARDGLALANLRSDLSSVEASVLQDVHTEVVQRCRRFDAGPSDLAGLPSSSVCLSFSQTQVPLAYPSGKPLRSCMRQAGRPLRLHRRLHFNHEVMFWFPETVQLRMPKASLSRIHAADARAGPCLLEVGCAHPSIHTAAAPSMREVEHQYHLQGNSMPSVPATPSVSEVERAHTLLLDESTSSAAIHSFDRRCCSAVSVPASFEAHFSSCVTEDLSIAAQSLHRVMQCNLQQAAPSMSGVEHVNPPSSSPGQRLCVADTGKDNLAVQAARKPRTRTTPADLAVTPSRPSDGTVNHGFSATQSKAQGVPGDSTVALGVEVSGPSRTPYTVFDKLQQRSTRLRFAHWGARECVWDAVGHSPVPNPVGRALTNNVRGFPAPQVLVSSGALWRTHTACVLISHDREHLPEVVEFPKGSAPDQIWRLSTFALPQDLAIHCLVDGVEWPCDARIHNEFDVLHLEVRSGAIAGTDSSGVVRHCESPAAAASGVAESHMPPTASESLSAGLGGCDSRTGEAARGTEPPNDGAKEGRRWQWAELPLPTTERPPTPPLPATFFDVDNRRSGPVAFFTVYDVHHHARVFERSLADTLADIVTQAASRTPELKRPWHWRVLQRGFDDMPSPQIVLWDIDQQGLRVAPGRFGLESHSICTIAVPPDACALQIAIGAQNSCGLTRVARVRIARQETHLRVNDVPVGPFVSGAAVSADTFRVCRGPPLATAVPRDNVRARWTRPPAPHMQRGDAFAVSDGDPDMHVMIHTVRRPPFMLFLDPLCRLGVFNECVRAHLSAARGGRLRLPHFCPAMPGCPLHLVYDERGKARMTAIVDVRRVARPPRPMFIAVELPGTMSRTDLVSVLSSALPEVDFRGHIFLDDELLTAHATPLGHTPLVTVLPPKGSQGSPLVIDTLRLLELRPAGRTHLRANREPGPLRPDRIDPGPFARAMVAAERSDAIALGPTDLALHYPGPSCAGLGAVWIIAVDRAARLQHFEPDLAPREILRLSSCLLHVPSDSVLRVPLLAPYTETEAPWILLLHGTQPQGHFLLVDASRVSSPPCLPFWILPVHRRLTLMEVILDVRAAQPSLLQIGALYIDCHLFRGEWALNSRIQTLTLLPATGGGDDLPVLQCNSRMVQQRPGYARMSMPARPSIAQSSRAAAGAQAIVATTTTTTAAGSGGDNLPGTFSTTTSTMSPPGDFLQQVKGEVHFIAACGGCKPEVIVTDGPCDAAVILGRLAARLHARGYLPDRAPFRVNTRVYRLHHGQLAVFAATGGEYQSGRPVWVDLGTVWPQPFLLLLPWRVNAADVLRLAHWRGSGSVHLTVNGIRWNGDHRFVYNGDVIQVRDADHALLTWPIYYLRHRVRHVQALLFQVEGPLRETVNSVSAARREGFFLDHFRRIFMQLTAAIGPTSPFVPVLIAGHGVPPLLVTVGTRIAPTAAVVQQFFEDHLEARFGFRTLVDSHWSDHEAYVFVAIEPQFPTRLWAFTGPMQEVHTEVGDELGLSSIPCPFGRHLLSVETCGPFGIAAARLLSDTTAITCPGLLQSMPAPPYELSHRIHATYDVPLEYSLGTPPLVTSGSVSAASGSDSMGDDNSEDDADADSLYLLQRRASSLRQSIPASMMRTVATPCRRRRETINHEGMEAMSQICVHTVAGYQAELCVPNCATVDDVTCLLRQHVGGADAGCLVPVFPPTPGQLRVVQTSVRPEIVTCLVANAGLQAFVVRQFARLPPRRDGSFCSGGPLYYCGRPIHSAMPLFDGMLLTTVGPGTLPFSVAEVPRPQGGCEPSSQTRSIVTGLDTSMRHFAFAEFTLDKLSTCTQRLGTLHPATVQALRQCPVWDGAVFHAARIYSDGPFPAPMARLRGPSVFWSTVRDSGALRALRLTSSILQVIPCT